MTRSAWDTLTPEQQRAEWARFHAWQASQVRPAGVPTGPARTASPVRPRSPWPWLIGVLCGAVALCLVPVVIAVVAAFPGTTTVTGDVTVTGNTSASLSGSGGSCYTYGGYDDIAYGTTVTVRDPADAIVAIGSLDAGTAESGSCVFDFTVPDVPESSFYSVEVSKRGPLTYSSADIENGTIHQSLDSSW